MDTFLERVSDVLEVEATDDTVLRDCDTWDSLTALSLVALADKHYRVTVTADDLIRSVTVGDLRRLIEERVR
jgi:acyl carrier protein